MFVPSLFIPTTLFSPRMAAAPVTPKTTSESIFQKRVKNFKKIGRAYYSLIILGILYLLSFFAPLLVNNKALIVSHNGSYYFPALGDLFGASFPLLIKKQVFLGRQRYWANPDKATRTIAS
ncbi:MAG: hypothetical protein IPL33_08235 [Sphingobacteriales bacterium]|nr:hypothetical protein [Sphingobacteriales bacterium]